MPLLLAARVAAALRRRFPRWPRRTTTCTACGAPPGRGHYFDCPTRRDR